MGSTFNPHILVEKLSKLNNSQASIETLSHWCIFHMNKAKQVVETWDRQFHCSSRDRRLAFLYLANDILQNSRRKGAEFVVEFWKVLPDALRNVIDNGDEFGRNAALRLIGIWEERKVFGSQGQILKEELVGRHLDNNNRNGKPLGTKLVNKQPVGTLVDKLISSYQAVHGRQLDEDVLLRKCKEAISSIEKVDKESSSDINSGKQNGSEYAEGIQGQNVILKGCIEQLTAIESSRASLVSYLREALQEQEFKLDQIRHELQAAHSQSERAGNICRQFPNHDHVQLAEESSKDIHSCTTPQSFVTGSMEQSAPVMYTRQLPYTEKTGLTEEDDPLKSAAAAVAAKLTASTSSAQMLSFVLSSLASEGPPEKRPKLEPPYIPAQTFQLPGPHFTHVESFQYNLATTTPQLAHNEPPPPLPSSSPPPLPPPPPMPGLSMPSAGSISSLPYSYSMPQPPSLTSYQIGNGISPFTAAQNSYQSLQGSEGNTNFYTQPSSMPMAPISRQ